VCVFVCVCVCVCVCVRGIFHGVQFDIRHGKDYI